MHTHPYTSSRNVVVYSLPFVEFWLQSMPIHQGANKCIKFTKISFWPVKIPRLLQAVIYNYATLVFIVVVC